MRRKVLKSRLYSEINEISEIEHTREKKLRHSLETVSMLCVLRSRIRSAWHQGFQHRLFERFRARAKLCLAQRERRNRGQRAVSKLSEPKTLPLQATATHCIGSLETRSGLRTGWGWSVRRTAAWAGKPAPNVS